jgi:aconitate hydratase
VGENITRARIAGGHGLPEQGGSDGKIWMPWASTLSVTAARPVSVTPVRCRSDRVKRWKAGDLTVTAVLSGNRNFEGRISPHVKANYLASPPLVVAYAIAGSLKIDMYERPDRHIQRRQGCFPERHLADESRKFRYAGRILPDAGNVQKTLFATCSKAEGMAGHRGRKAAETYKWDDEIDLCSKPALFRGHAENFHGRHRISRARLLMALFGDSITTDHISPAGSIKKDSPAGKYLIENGVKPVDFQLLRRAPRQPRSDDARHLCQHPHQE